MCYSTTCGNLQQTPHGPTPLPPGAHIPSVPTVARRRSETTWPATVKCTTISGEVARLLHEPLARDNDNDSRRGDAKVTPTAEQHRGALSGAGDFVGDVVDVWDVFVLPRPMTIKIEMEKKEQEKKGESTRIRCFEKRVCVEMYCCMCGGN